VYKLYNVCEDEGGRNLTEKDAIGENVGGKGGRGPRQRDVRPARLVHLFVHLSLTIDQVV